MSFLTKLFGDPNAKVIREIQPLVAKINSFEPTLQKLSNDELKAKTAEFKKRWQQGETLDDILPAAFAVVREASKRTTGMRHFDVQLIGGVALHRGQIAEMRTGEGKTLVATLPIYLNALTSKGVHLVTVNDYLAKRDAVWMGQIYDALDLTVGVIQNLLVSYRYKKSEIQNPKSETDLGEGSAADQERDAKGAYKVEYEYLEKCSRQEAYQCDIVYGTNNEFGFDYLRDNMVGSLADMAQRPLHYAIVDEVDSILVDEARTPLIISAPAAEATEQYYKFAELVERLAEAEDYNVDEKMRAATLTDAGIKKMEGWLGVANIYAEGGLALVHHLEQALRAKTLFKRDRDYVVENGEVIIVDEFTGRKMLGRRYSEGLHQAIEGKEGVAIQRESQTMATITFQNYFRMYAKLAGMTGTAVTEAEEFGKIYKLEVVVIPTNKSSRRLDSPDRIYKTQAAKFEAIAREVKELQTKGQPVLIGTVSVEKNEALSLYLDREGIAHEILNAKNHEREGEIIAQAGRPGAVTLATNMAGRGVDIILGGNPPSAPEAGQAKEAGGLFVIGTERHEARRIDNQLRGRAGRQGDQGSSRFYLSTEDDLMRIFAGERIKRIMNTLRVPDDMPIENKTLSKIIESAQKKVEGFHFDSRKHLLEYDDVINRHREVIYGKRREILEAFARENTVLSPLAPALGDKSAAPPTPPASPPLWPPVQGLERRAQGREVGQGGMTATPPSPLLRFAQDRLLARGGSETLSSSQEAAGVAEAKTLRQMILEYVESELEQLISFHTGSDEQQEWNVKEIAETAATIFPLAPAEQDTIAKFSRPSGDKLDVITERTRFIEYLTELSRAKYDELLVKKTPHPELIREVEKQVLLRAIDTLWVEHLVAIDYLRTGIGLRGYGQRDPLVEYKKETYRMFNELLSLIQREVVYTIYKISAGIELAPSLMQGRNLMFKGASDVIGGSFGPSEEPTGATVVYTSSKPKTPEGAVIGRNDPCYCDSGKKFKKCHGA